MAEDIGSLNVKVAMDSTSFQQGMQNLKRQMSIIDSEFKANTAALGENAKGVEGLKVKANMLSEKLKVQSQVVSQYKSQLDKSKDSLSKNSDKLAELKNKVDSAKKAYENSKKTLGENDEATKKYKKELEALNKEYSTQENKVRNNEKAVDGYTIQLNNAKAKLSNFENELKATNQEIDKQASEVKKDSTAWEGLSNKVKQSTSRMADSLKQSTAKMKASFGAIKDAMGAVGILAAGYLKGAIESGAKAEKINKNLEQTIKSTGKAAGMTAEEISNMAKAESRMTTFSAGMIKQGDAMLLTFTNIGKTVFPQASMAMLDLSQKMGVEPQKAAIQLGKALNDPVKGITALTRVGVTFSKQQKDQIKVLMEHNRVADAQKIILAELNKEFGGQAAAAASGYDGQMKQLQNTMNSIKSTIGTALLPYINKIAVSLNGVADVVADFVAKNKGLVTAILASTAGFGTLIGGAGLVQKTMAILGPVVSGLGSAIAALAAPIGVVVLAIAGLGVAYKTNFMGFKTLVDGFVGRIKSGFSAVSTEFKKSGDIVKALGVGFEKAFGPEAGKVITTSLSVMKDAFNGLVGIIKDHMPQIKAVAIDLVNTIKRIWDTILKPTLQVVGDLVLFLVNLVKQHMPEIKATFSACFTGIQVSWNSVLKPVLNYIISTVGQVVGFIKQNVGPLKEFISEIVDVIVYIIKTNIERIKTMWSIFGPTISGMVKNTVNGLKTVISTGLKLVEDVISLFLNLFTGHWGKAWSSFKDIFKTAWSGVKSIISQSLNNMAFLFKNAAKGAVKLGENIVKAVVKGIKNCIKDVYNAGVSVIEGFVKGIKGALGKVKDAAGNIASTVKGGLKSVLKINSPSKVVAELGKSVPEGFAKGMNDHKGMVTKATSDLADSVKSTMKNKQKAIQDAMNYKIEVPKIDYSKPLAEQKKAQKEALASQKKAIAEHKKAIAEHQKAINDAAKNIKNTYMASIIQLSGKIQSVLKPTTDLAKWEKELTQAQKLQAEIVDKAQQSYNGLVKVKGKNSSESLAALKLLQSEQKQYDNYGKQIEATNKKIGDSAVRDIKNNYAQAIAGLDAKIKNALSSTKDLTEKEKGLKEAIGLQSQVVKDTQQQYDKLVKLKGKNSAEATNAYKALQIEKTQLNGLNNELKKNESAMEKVSQNKMVSAIKDKFTTAIGKLNLEIQTLNKTTGSYADKLEANDKAMQDSQMIMAGYAIELARLANVKGDAAEKERKRLQEALNKEQLSYQGYVQKHKELTQKIADDEAKKRQSQIDNINKLNEKIVNALQKRYEKEQKTQEDSISKQIDNLDKWKDENLKAIETVYNSKVKLLDNDTENQVNGLQAKIDALDAQQEAEEKAKQDKEELDNITALNSQLLAEQDADKKVDIQKQLNEALQSRQERLHKEEIESQKESLKKQIDSIKNAAEQKKEVLQQEQDANKQSIEASYNSQKAALDNQLQSVKDFYVKKLEQANLNAEAEKLIVNNNQTQIVALINSFGDKYEDAGATLGERLMNGMQGKIQSLKQQIASITSNIPSLSGPRLETSTWKNSMPSFGGWYDSGAIFNQPTIVGVGEKRPEFVGALSDLKSIVKSAISEVGGGTGNITIEVPINLEGKQIGKITAPYVAAELAMGTKRGR